MEQAFFERLAAIDSAVQKGPTDCNIRMEIKPLLLEHAAVSYFFENLRDPRWIFALVQSGMFRNVPGTEVPGAIQMAPGDVWPQSRFLARIAGDARGDALEQVANLIVELGATRNIRVREDLCDASLGIPPQTACRIVPAAKSWVGESRGSLLPEKLGKLTSRLARGGQTDEALDLAAALLALEGPRAEAHFDIWQYDHVVKSCVPDLVLAAGERALVLVVDLLQRAVDSSLLSTESHEGRDDSHMWRPAVEDHEQNRPGDAKNSLVTAVRDSADYLMKLHHPAVLQIVEQRRFKIFQRIGLYLRRKWPQADPEGTARLVGDPSTFDDVHLHHEMYHLLHECFNQLPDAVQQSYLRLTDKGLDRAERLQTLRQHIGEELAEKRIDGHLRHWRFAKLWPIRDCLEGKWLNEFEELRKEFGDPDHPDFGFYMGPSWAGPTSPRDESDLRSTSDDDLFGYLASWGPSREWMSPSREGLAQQLQAVIAEDPERFARQSDRFRKLYPIYITALLIGLREGMKKGRQISSWDDVLDLCSWVVRTLKAGHRADMDTATGNNEIGDPRAVRSAVADLLSDGFDDDPGRIPFGLRKPAWKILLALTSDPKPTPENERRYVGSNMDPATLSINTVRGKAMHAVIRHALWVRRCSEEAIPPEQRKPRGFAIMKEVKAVLNWHLDPKRELSPAIRSVYGQYLPQLMSISPRWVSQNVARIFPTEEQYAHLRVAAWETYVIFCNPYSQLLDLLEDEYSAAVGRIGKRPEEAAHVLDPDERLADHLMAFYWRGRLGIDEPGGLLEQFYQKASVKLRVHAIEFLGRWLSDQKAAADTEGLARMRRLWEHRLEAARNAQDSSSFTEELAAFGWWFASGRFDDSWAIDHVSEALRLAGRVEGSSHVVKRLGGVAGKLPLEAVECLDLIAKGEREHWQIERSIEDARVVLATALGSTDARARRAAEDLVHRLGARGFLEFRNLLAVKRSRRGRHNMSKVTISENGQGLRTWDKQPLKTKIVATIGGPTAYRDGILDLDLRPAAAPITYRYLVENLVRNGVNVIRLNMAYVDRAAAKEFLDAVREFSLGAREDIPRFAILVDLPGPRIRFEDVPASGIEVERDQDFRIYFDQTVEPNGKGASVYINRTLLKQYDGGVAYQDIMDEIDRRVRRHLEVRVAVGDGNVILEIDPKDFDRQRRDAYLDCKVIKKGYIGRDRFTVKNIDFTIPSFTQEDQQKIDMLFNCGAFTSDGVWAFVGLSFAQEPDDALRAKRYLEARTQAHLEAQQLEYRWWHAPALIAKIETRKGYENRESILDVVDGIMVARGDLGVQMDVEEIGTIQKTLIQLCNERGKPVITATQMLRSMVDSLEPTRAEVMDVFNSIVDGTDAVMLSEETSTGCYPFHAARKMAYIAGEAEHFFERLDVGKEERRKLTLQRMETFLANADTVIDDAKGRIESAILNIVRKAAGAADDQERLRELEWSSKFYSRELSNWQKQRTTDTISDSACINSENDAIKAIVPVTTTGRTARMISRFRPNVRVIGVTHDEYAACRLVLSYGVSATVLGDVDTRARPGEMFRLAAELLKGEQLLKPEDGLVLTSGCRPKEPGTTTTIEIQDRLSSILEAEGQDQQNIQVRF